MALTLLGVGPYAGRGLSYLAAASSTWYLNRRITFAGRRSPAVGLEWVKFVLLNAAGGGVNYAAYAIWLHHFGFSGFMPACGVALGSLSGLCINFTLSRQLVFRRLDSPPDDGSEWSQ
jgi:putative flippase GtrA